MHSHKVPTGPGLGIELDMAAIERYRIPLDDPMAQALTENGFYAGPGGRIIYMTCSVLASEGEQQIDRLLAGAPELELADIGEIWQDTIGTQQGGACPPLDGGVLRLLPGRDGTDGFFIAVLQTCLR